MRIGRISLRDIARHPHLSIRVDDYIGPAGAVTAVISYDKRLIREVQETAHVDEQTAIKLTEDAITRALEEFADSHDGYSLELHYEDMLERGDGP